MNTSLDSQPVEAPRKSPARIVMISVAVCGIIYGGVVFVALPNYVDSEAERARVEAIESFRDLGRRLESGQENALGPGNPPSPENFAPKRELRQQPVVTGFKFLSAEKAKGKIDDDELVLAVEIEGVARAYPINMLNGPTREIVNDKLGGRAIAATW